MQIVMVRYRIRTVVTYKCDSLCIIGISRS